MKRFLIVLVFLGLGILPGFSTSIAAQPTSWTAPFEVSGTLQGWFPDLAIAQDGSIHIVWYGGIDKGSTENFIDLLAYRDLKDGKWSAVNSIFAPSTGGFTVRNALVMGRDGRLHVLLRNRGKIQYSSAPWDSAWSAHAWATPRTIGEGYYDGLAIDSKGTLHAIWTGTGNDDPKHIDKACPNCNDLFYRRSTDGGATWSTPINLSSMPGGEDKPQIKIDQQDHVGVFWDHGRDWYDGKGGAETGMYRQSQDGGKTWDPPTTFKIPGAKIAQTSVATTSAGHRVAVYRDTESSDIYFQISTDTGKTWQAPAKIPGVFGRNVGDPPLDIYSMVADSADNVHLLMVGFKTAAEAEHGIPSLLHLVWSGSSWSAPEVVASSSFYPEWPRVVLFNGNQLHAVWFTRDKLYGAGDERIPLRVWYSSKVLDTPRTAPITLFTPTPSTAPALPTATPIPIPTPTVPPNIIDAPPIDQSVAWEGPGILAVGMATISTVALLVLAVGTTSMLRRVRRRPRD